MKTILAAVLAVGLTCVAANAQTRDAAQSGVYLMDRAGETRMLTQRLLRRACYINVVADLGMGDMVGLDSDVSRFDDTISLIRNGNRRIEPTRAPQVILSLKEVDEAWSSYKNFARFAQRGEMPDPYLRAMAYQRDGMVAAQERLVKSIARTYGHGRLDPYTVNTMSTLARLRMLANLIAVEHCLTASTALQRDTSPVDAALTRFSLELSLLETGNDTRKILAPSDEMMPALRCVRIQLTRVEQEISEVPASVATVSGLRAATATLFEVADAALKQLETELTGRVTFYEKGCVQPDT